MNPELKKINKIKDAMFIAVISIYIILGLITAYAISNQIFSYEVFFMRLTCAILILVVYILAFKVIKAHENCLRKIPF